MSAEDPERDERELRALFDRTAERLDGPGLTKLRARAGDVPSSTRRRPWWLVFAPIMAIAAGALIVVLFRSKLHSGGEPMAQSGERAVPSLSAVALASKQPAPPSSTEVPDSNDDEADLEVADLGVAGD